MEKQFFKTDNGSKALEHGKKLAALGEAIQGAFTWKDADVVPADFPSWEALRKALHLASQGKPVTVDRDHGSVLVGPDYQDE